MTQVRLAGRLRRGGEWREGPSHIHRHRLRSHTATATATCVTNAPPCYSHICHGCPPHAMPMSTCVMGLPFLQPPVSLGCHKCHPLLQPSVSRVPPPATATCVSVSRVHRSATATCVTGAPLCPPPHTPSKRVEGERGGQGPGSKWVEGAREGGGRGPAPPPPTPHPPPHPPTHTHTHTRTHVHARTHTDTHARKDAHAHARAHTHTHGHSHSHLLPCPPLL